MTNVHHIVTGYFTSVMIKKVK